MYITFSQSIDTLFPVMFFGKKNNGEEIRRDMKAQDLKALQLLLKNEMDFDSICKCFPGYKKTTEDTHSQESRMINSESMIIKKANCS